MDHPFWKKSFLVSSPDELQSIRNSNVAELIINTDKGLDVLVEADPAPVVAPPEVSATKPEPVPVAAPAIVHAVGTAPVSMDRELGQAAQIMAQSQKAVFNMFQEARLGKAVDEQSMRPLVEEISASVSRNSGALIGLARLKNKDDYTYMHSVAVCALMMALGRQMQLSEEEVRKAGMAGLLHDIGKMAIPNEILNKPDKLTDSEFVTVKQHPQAGYDMLSRSKEMSAEVLDVCLHHHEKMNGTGYPFGFKGTEISLLARMGAVCDVYDAITSNRPYKRGWCPSESIKKMSEWSGPHFDERVFQAFVKSVGIYPVGSLVLLKSGRLGVVIEQKEESLLTPMVRVFFSTKSMAYIAPDLLDLSKPGVNDKIVSRETAIKWGLKDVDTFWLGDAAPKTSS